MNPIVCCRMVATWIVAVRYLGVGLSYVALHGVPHSQLIGHLKPVGGRGGLCARVCAYVCVRVCVCGNNGSKTLKKSVLYCEASLVRHNSWYACSM